VCEVVVVVLHVMKLQTCFLNSICVQLEPVCIGDSLKAALSVMKCDMILQVSASRSQGEKAKAPAGEEVCDCMSDGVSYFWHQYSTVSDWNYFRQIYQQSPESASL